MSNFRLRINVNFKIPRLSDANIPLGQIADKIVEDSRSNIRRQQSPYGLGGAFKPLSKNTIRKKKKAGYTAPTKALIATNMMFRSIRKYKDGKNKISVGVKGVGAPPRDFIGMIHQQIGVKSNRYGRVVRPFIGISKKTRAWARNRMKRWAKKRIESAVPRYIKINLT